VTKGNTDSRNRGDFMLLSRQRSNAIHVVHGQHLPRMTEIQLNGLVKSVIRPSPQNGLSKQGH
jgi:hypothetical protein